jgi:hypothetical protein
MSRISITLGLIVLGASVHAPVVSGQEPAPAAGQVAARERGQREPPRFAVADRNRLTITLGFWDTPADPGHGRVVYSGAYSNDLSAGLEYTRFLSEYLAVNLGAHVLPIDAGSVVGRHGISSGSRTIVFVPLGLHFNPGGGQTRGRSVKPYLLAGLGPVVGTVTGSELGRSGVRSGARTEVAIGARLGGGVDFMLGRSWAASLEAGYNWMADFEQPIGAHDNYGGFELRVGIGWLFGKGKPVAN